MLTITAICDLYAYLYTSLPVPAGTWDHIIPVDGAYAAIKRVDGIDYVMFRGSRTFLDWIDDFDDMAIPVSDAILGPVHPGFRIGVQQVKDQIDALVGEHVVIVGHSLGAGHAALYAGYRVASAKSVDAVIMFGEPRPGGPKLSALLAKTIVKSFRNADKNGHDYVTDVPRALLPEIPYQHVREPLTDVWHSPRADDPYLIFKYHHFGHYCRAFGCGSNVALSLPI